MAQATTALHSPPTFGVTDDRAGSVNIVRHKAFSGHACKVETPSQHFQTRLAGHCQRLPRRWLLPRCKVGATEPRLSSQPEAKAPKVTQPAGFVCRESEKNWLAHELLEGTSPQITILLGPSGTGKTAILQHYKETCGNNTAQPTYIPCRSIQAMEDVGKLDARSIMDKLLAPYNEHLAGVGASILAAQPSGQLPCPRGRSKNALGPILIDDAEVMEESLFLGTSQQLRLLRVISNEQRVAHVVMATSSPMFVDWVKKKSGASYIAVCALGDLTEEHARAFFNTCHESPVDDDVWDEIYQVCGGNMGLLRQAATFNGRDLNSVLVPLWRPILTHMQEAIRGGALAPYTKIAIEELVNAPHHAVGVSTLEEKLHTFPVKHLLGSLGPGLFTTRPYSGLAWDMPREVYGTLLDPVVMAATPAHLYCMKLLFKKKESETLVQQVAQPAETKKQTLVQQVTQPAKTEKQRVPGGPWLFFTGSSLGVRLSNCLHGPYTHAPHLPKEVNL